MVPRLRVRSALAEDLGLGSQEGQGSGPVSLWWWLMSFIKHISLSHVFTMASPPPLCGRACVQV